MRSPSLCFFIVSLHRTCTERVVFIRIQFVFFRARCCTRDHDALDTRCANTVTVTSGFTRAIAFSFPLSLSFSLPVSLSFPLSLSFSISLSFSPFAVALLPDTSRWQTAFDACPSHAY